MFLLWGRENGGSREVRPFAKALWLGNRQSHDSGSFSETRARVLVPSVAQRHLPAAALAGRSVLQAMPVPRVMSRLMK